jgi:hypothetical protein
MRAVAAALLSTLALGCATHWHTTRADRPLSRGELGIHPVTVDPGPEPLRTKLVWALVEKGFRLVDHPPYHGDLRLRLQVHGAHALAELTSDDFFVDQAEIDVTDPAQAAAALVESLAVSDGLAFYMRYGGVPAQLMLQER